MSDRTATKRLRELLDGAGMAHVDYGGITEFTGASGCTCRVYARQEAGRLDVAITSVTPEQAIAATAGGTGEFHMCKRCGIAYEIDFIDELGKARFCPHCGYRGEVGE